MSILSRGGYDGVVTCTSGVQALSAMDDLGSGVIICGYRLSDMLYSELLEDLPAYFKMVMVASTNRAPLKAIILSICPRLSREQIFFPLLT